MALHLQPSVVESLCGKGSTWGPISPDRLDLTPCFEHSILLGAVSFLTWIAIVSRIHYLRSFGVKHSFGRTAWIYWPSQAAMTLIGAFALLNASLAYGQQEGSVAAMAGYFVLGLTWWSAVVLNALEHQYTIRSSDLIFVYYLVSILSASLIAHTMANLHQSDTPQFHILLSMLVVLILGFTIEAWPRQSTQVQIKSRATAYDRANLASRASFQFLQPLVSLSVKRPITAEDLAHQLPEDMTTAEALPWLDNPWKRNLREYSQKTADQMSSGKGSRSKKPTISLFRTILWANRRSFFPILFFRTSRPLLLFSIPGLLSLFLAFLQKARKDPDGVGADASYGFLLAGAIFMAAFTGAILQVVSRRYSCVLGYRTKVALTAMIYRKSLRLSPGSRQNSSAGGIINHMSVDADSWSDGFLFLSMWISLPVELFTAMWLLYQLLGWSFMAGILAMFLMTPLQVWRGMVYGKMQKHKLTIMDERTRLTTEVLAGIKIVKLYCWEVPFLDRILAIRFRELEALKRLGRIFSIMSIIFTSSTLIISLLTLSVYALWGGPGWTRGVLTPQTVYVSMTLFNMLRTPIASLSEATTTTIGIMVATKRIQDFLMLEEIDETEVVRTKNLPRDPTEPLVILRDATFAWSKAASSDADGPDQQQQQQERNNEGGHLDDTQPLLDNEESDVSAENPTLRNISLSIHPGSLTAIVGRVGQGKSSLLSAIVGEMYKLQGSVQVSGRVAWVPQQSWILNATVRDNILFGQVYDKVRYDQIVHAAGLDPDIAMLPAGDQTEIGERGINLSGGQKQRVSLARAAYADADLYLFDDPLSAVDAHVDRHLWQKLIGPKGLLRHKTRVLVTHGIHHLKDMDGIVLIKEGEIVEQGSFADLVGLKQTFYQLISEYAVQEQVDGLSSSSSGSSSIMSAEESPAEESLVGGVEEQEEADADTNRTITLQDTTSKSEAKGDKGEGQAQLVMDEKITEGQVTLKTAMIYIRAWSYKSMIAIIVFHILAQASLVGTSLWLKYWIKETEEYTASLQAGAQGPSAFSLVAAPPSLRLFLSVFALLTVVYVSMHMVIIYVGFVMARIRASEILHRQLLMNIMRLPMSFFDTTPLGRIINRTSSDLAAIDDKLPWAVDGMIYYTVSVTSTFLIVACTNPVLLFAIPFFAAVCYVIQRYFICFSLAARRIFQVAKSPIFQHFQETLAGVSTLRAMNLQQDFMASNAEKYDRYMNFQLVYMYCLRWLEVRLHCLSAVVIFLVAILFVVERKTVDPAMAGLVMSFALTITAEVNMLVRRYPELLIQLVNVERVQELIELKTEAPATIDPSVISSMGATLSEDWPEQGKIVFKNYSTRYREGLELVLKGISFEVQAGEKIGIVGRTGAGKSSLTLALFRIIEAANSPWNRDEATSLGSDDEHQVGGTIEIDGVDISTLGLTDLRKHLAIIPQDPVLFAGTLRDNLDPFQECSDTELWEALARSHLKPMAAIQSQSSSASSMMPTSSSSSSSLYLPAGLDSPVQPNGENFSVGQRSLICLARALLRKTRILVLDEATSAVDVETDELIQQTIRKEFADRTILTIAHRIKTVMDSDKILVLDQGKVAEFSDPKVLLRDSGSAFFQLAQQAGEVV